MADRVLAARVSADPIDPAALAASVLTDADGAVVEFRGVVRDHDGGRAVAALDYEAHPDAGLRLRDAADDIARRHPEVRIAVAHRVGALEVGDPALVCAVAAAHRAAAFAACAELVDAIKETVPIWKRQRFADGTAEWVGIAD